LGLPDDNLHPGIISLAIGREVILRNCEAKKSYFLLWMLLFLNNLRSYRLYNQYLFAGKI